MKKLAIPFLALFLFLSFVLSANAKVLPQSKKATSSSSSKSAGSSAVVSPRLRKDRQALIVYFGNIQNAQTISYTLTYQTNGQNEGVVGSVSPSEGTSISREFFFGTCSKNSCRHHTNLTNMKFEVTIHLKSGKKIIKRFRVRV